VRASLTEGHACGPNNGAQSGVSVGFSLAFAFRYATLTGQS
jgi:hypothetical protein